MVVNEAFIRQVCEEYGFEVPFFTEAFNCTRKQLPYIFYRIAKEKCGVESIGEFLCTESMNDYLFEDDLEEFTEYVLEENEFVVCDRSLENIGIHPTDIILCDPKDKDNEEDKLMVIKVAEFVFAAVLEECADDPQKYLLKIDGLCENFSMFIDEIKILGAAIGWRRPNEYEHREF